MIFSLIDKATASFLTGEGDSPVPRNPSIYRSKVRILPRPRNRSHARDRSIESTKGSENQKIRVNKMPKREESSLICARYRLDRRAEEPDLIGEWIISDRKGSSYRAYIYLPRRAFSLVKIVQRLRRPWLKAFLHIMRFSVRLIAQYSNMKHLYK